MAATGQEFMEATVTDTATAVAMDMAVMAAVSRTSLKTHSSVISTFNFRFQATLMDIHTIITMEDSSDKKAEEVIRLNKLSSTNYLFHQ